MSDDPLRQADLYFAEGDYVRALDELRKSSALDQDTNSRIHAALGRMKDAAAREFAMGRWSVAEGIVDAAQEHETFMSPAVRSECRRLALEISRGRDRERQVLGIVQAAATLALEGRFAQARELALQMMASCSDAPLVARLRRLLSELPHPLGRLLYGFDSPLEVEQFVRPEGTATIEPMAEESHPLGGAYLRVRFPRSGASIGLVDPPPDWSNARELSLCLRLVMPERTAFRISAGDGRGAWTYETKVIDPYWNQVRVPLDQFVRQGDADWRSITCLAIASSSPEPSEFMLDEIRLRARPS